jgi:hypothetical protein
MYQFLKKISISFQVINLHKCKNSQLSPTALTNQLLKLFYSNNEMCNVHSRYFPIEHHSLSHILLCPKLWACIVYNDLKRSLFHINVLVPTHYEH